MLIETLFTALAIWGGTLQATPTPQYQYRSRAPRRAEMRVVHTHHVPLPKQRPVTGVIAPRTPPVASVSTDPPYPFVWHGPYDLPPKWVQLWQFVA